MNERKIIFSFDKESSDMFSEFLKNEKIALKDVWNSLKINAERILYEGIKKKQLLLSSMFDPSLDKPEFRIVEFTITEDSFIKQYEKDFIPFLIKNQLKLADDCLDWLKLNNRIKSDRSLLQYQMLLSCMIQFMKKPISSWNDKDFTAFINERTRIMNEKRLAIFERLKQLGRVSGNFKEKSLAIKTIRQKKNILRSFMNYCIHNNFVEKSGITFIKESSRNVFTKNMGSKKDQEVFSVLKAFIDLLPYDYQIKAQIMFHSLLRVSEVLKIQFIDINFENRVLTAHGKGNKDRSVPLDKDINAMLYNYILDKHFRLNLNNVLNERPPYIHLLVDKILSPEVEGEKIKRIAALKVEAQKIGKSVTEENISSQIEKETISLEKDISESKKARAALGKVSYNDWINEIDSIFQICIVQKSGIIFKHVAPSDLKDAAKKDILEVNALDKYITLQDQNALQNILYSLDGKKISDELKAQIRATTEITLYRQNQMKELWYRLSLIERNELKAKEYKALIGIRQRFSFTNLETPFLFPSIREPNRIIDVTSAMHVFENVNRKHDFPAKYNCPPITSHWFRAWGTTLRSLNGMVTSELQDMLGHSSANTTRIYEKMSLDRMQNAAETSNISVFM